MGTVCANGNSDGQDQTVEQVPRGSVDKPMPEEATGDGEPKYSVMIVGARGLRDADWVPGGGKSDCYCEVKASRKLVYTTAVEYDTCEPFWGEECEVAEMNDAGLEFAVYDKDAVTSDSLGKVALPKKEFSTEGFNGEVKLETNGKEEAYLMVKVRLIDGSYPKGPSPEVILTVERTSKDVSFGLDLDMQDGKYLYVMEVKAGAFQTYNESVSPNEQIRKGDYITSVNDDSSSSEKMLEQFRANLKVECKVVHPVVTTVTFDRMEASMPLGLTVPLKPQGDYLTIKGVTAGGAAENHNAAAKSPDQKFYSGERIIEVDGFRGQGLELLEKLKAQGGKHRVQLARPAKQSSDSGTSFTHWLWG